MKFLMQAFRFCFFVFSVLLLSQIPVRGVRICDHFANIVHTNKIKQGADWITNKIDLKAITSATIPQRDQNLSDRISATNKTSPIQKDQAREKISESEKRDLKKILERLKNSD